MPPQDGVGWLFLATAAVFGLACLVVLRAILRRGGANEGPASTEGKGGEERAWWSSEAGAHTRPGLRAVLEELVWLAVPILLLLWLWSAI